MKKNRVIFHINEENKWNTLIANLNNLINDMGIKNLDIEVLANGSAVKSYIENNSEVIIKIKKISNVGVRFVACRNSLLGNKIEETVLPSFVKVVPTGVSQLVKRQNEGYAYIKP